jgi:hypothetical protein
LEFLLEFGSVIENLVKLSTFGMGSIDCEINAKMNTWPTKFSGPYLTVCDHEYQELPPLENFTSLRHFGMFRGLLKNVTGIGLLFNLTVLNLCDNQLSKLPDGVWTADKTATIVLE